MADMDSWVPTSTSEIADVIIYLASGASSFVTGQILMADGGYSAR